jgi:hypothetical protein
LRGEKLPPRDPKIAYNGADGVPIREEILDKQGETVITRNSYGAHCLNTPNALFVDVDYPESFPGKFELTGFVIFFGVFLAIIQGFFSGWSVLSSVVLSGILAGIARIVLLPRLFRLSQKLRGGATKIALQHIHRFAQAHPDWNLRIYGTPRGLRVLVTHQPFNPSDPAVVQCFKAFKADPMYEVMCLKQQCFRARVSAKPWRIGVAQLKTRGVWPIAPERRAVREQWIQTYEAAARRYAACTFLENVGSGKEHPDIRPVRELHDRLCRALSRLPTA